MSRIFRLNGVQRSAPEVVEWFDRHSDVLGNIARRWFDVMRGCGDDVGECVHDQQPTACVGDVAFAYVATFKAHVNIGFFAGADLPDPAGLLGGTGKFMRHVKIEPDKTLNVPALHALIATAYTHMKSLAESR